MQTSLLSLGSWGQARSVSACWLALRREKEGSGELSSLLSRGRRRVGPGSTGQGFLSSQTVIYFVWFVSGASQKASTPQAAGIIGNEQPWPVKVALPCERSVLASPSSSPWPVILPPLPSSLLGDCASCSDVVCLSSVLFSAENPLGKLEHCPRLYCDSSAVTDAANTWLLGGWRELLSSVIRPWLCHDPFTKTFPPQKSQEPFHRSWRAHPSGAGQLGR